jgi:anhydro-N-acetylmuramic acid kinase
MKTLVDHIALQISNSIEDLSGGDSSSKRVYVTGGGAYNTVLINHLRSHTDAEVIVPDSDIVEYKEALAFALLGILRVKNQINVLSSHTGAENDSVSGGLYGDFSKLT